MEKTISQEFVILQPAIKSEKYILHLRLYFHFQMIGLHVRLLMNQD